jgi:ABC-type Fe3+ transport system substrate-binding protein
MKRLDHLILSMQQADRAPDMGLADLLYYVPCPIKLVAKERIEAIALACANEGTPLVTHIPMGCTSVDPYDPLYMETDPDRLPAVIASIGFGDFWRKEFVQRFVDTGLFGRILPEVVNPMFTQAGMLDPDGMYTIYGVTPYIFLVDHQKLAGRPVPGTWGDLLDPMYKGELVMCGDGDDMADAVLLNIYKEFGEDGLVRLAANCKSLMHSSRMAKVSGTNAPDAGAVFIIPLFFAESTRLPDHVEVVWPADGAAASPLYFLAKKSERVRLASLIDFFIRDFGDIDSAGWFIPLDGSRPSRLPAHARLKWVGWDFIASCDINALRDELAVKFRMLNPGAACAS